MIASEEGNLEISSTAVLGVECLILMDCPHQLHPPLIGGGR